MRLRAALAIVLALITGCTGDEVEDNPDYEKADLPELVLRNAPNGTIADNDYPEVTLEDVAAGSDERRARFEGAGFVAAYQSTFLPHTDDPRFQGFMLTSRAYLFSDPAAGLEAIRATILDEGEDLIERAPLFADRPGFVLRGELDRALPPGVAIAWRKRNVILLVAVVAVSAVSESELRTIATQVDGLEPLVPIAP